MLLSNFANDSFSLFYRIEFSTLPLFQSLLIAILADAAAFVIPRKGYSDEKGKSTKYIRQEMSGSVPIVLDSFQGTNMYKKGETWN